MRAESAGSARVWGLGLGPVREAFGQPGCPAGAAAKPARPPLTCLPAAGSEGPAMKVAKVHSRCECQAHLSAELDEQRVALRGWAVDARKLQLPAPANSIGAERERFDVGWACPFCT